MGNVSRAVMGLVALGSSLFLAACGPDLPTGPAAGDTNSPAPNMGNSTPPPSATSPAQMVDKVEPNSLPILGSSFFWGAAGTRLGNWFQSPLPRDGAPSDGSTAIVDPARGDSTLAYRVQGNTRPQVLWAELDHPSHRSYDLSEYAGVAFWAKLDAADNHVAVGLNPGAPYDALSEIPHVDLTVSSNWTRYVVPFSDLGTDGRAVASIDFVVSGGGGPFDLWIDELALVCQAQCPNL